MPNDQANAQDALVIAQVLSTLTSAITNSLGRAVAEDALKPADPLSPTPFKGSASGAIEDVLSRLSTLSFTPAEVASVQAAIEHATQYENKVQQATGRAVQIIGVIKPLITKLIPLIV